MRTLFLLLAFVLIFTGTSAGAEQTQRASPGCTKGSAEAEKLFLRGIDYQEGLNGMPYDVQKAIKCYEEALALGNPKAAVNLGTLYRTAFASNLQSEKARFDYMNALYKLAADMGCSDGYYFLALSSYEGWGVKQNKRDGDAYVQKGIEAGSLPCIASYGLDLDRQGKHEEAKKWLQRALDGGFGLAGIKLHIIYLIEKNYPAMIATLRQGAKLGDTSCLLALSTTYKQGVYGQPQDVKYAQCFMDLYDSINNSAPPPLYENFDELCPPREVIPHDPTKLDDFGYPLEHQKPLE